MRGKKGFTLIEMLIVVALVAVVGLLMYTFFGQGLNLYTVESKSADQQASVREVLSDITNKARLTPSANITYDSGTGTLKVGSYAYKLEGDTIKRNGIVIADDISSFTVSISGGILEISLTGASGKNITTSVSLLK